MLKRYFRLREFISADFLPSRTMHRKLAALLTSLHDVESASKRLQAADLTLLDARDLFDGMMELRPSFAKYLAPDADIIHSEVLEQTVVKVLAGQPALLTNEEVAILEPFERQPGDVVVSGPSLVNKDGFAKRILKRRKVAAGPATFMLLEAIPPTTNMVEMFFSVARAVLRHERHRLSPIMLEMILFLKVNGSFWDVATVEQCL